MDGFGKVLVGLVAAFQSEGVSLGWTIPVVACSPLLCSSKEIRPQENPNNHCFPYLGFSTFNHDLFGR